MASLLKQMLQFASLNVTKRCGQRCPSSCNGPVVSCCFSTGSPTARARHFTPPSSYTQSGPRRYGYNNKMFAGGLLPRPHMEKPLPLPRYSPGENWAKKKALFGQNDYIDILGEGDLHPVDLIKGPAWIIGLKGNELQTLSRRLRCDGRRLKILYPTKYHQMKKRIYFLNKKYNKGRKSHSW